MGRVGRETSSDEYLGERQGLTGCGGHIVVNAKGPNHSGSSIKARQNASIDIAFRHTHTLGRVQQLQDFGAYIVQGSTASSYLSSSLPFLPRYLSVYASTEHFHTKALIAKLQHSILGLWLTVP